MRANPSFDAVNTRLPSALKYAVLTPLACRIGLPIAWPVEASQTCAASAGAAAGDARQVSGLTRPRESAAVTTCFPSGLNSTLSTQPKCNSLGPVASLVRASQ